MAAGPTAARFAPALRVATVAAWAVGWALLATWLFDPEPYVVRGPAFSVDNRVAEGRMTAAGLGALVGGLGGILALAAGRDSPWRILPVAILVGATVAGAAELVQELRYPLYGPPGSPPASPWIGAGWSAVLGAVVGLPAGIGFMAWGQFVQGRATEGR